MTTSTSSNKKTGADWAGRALAALAVTASLQALPAAATTYNAGALSLTPYTNNVSVAPGSFLDTYNFSVVDSGLDTTSAAVSITLDWSSVHLLHISNLNLSLYDSANTNLGSWTGDSPSFAQTLGLGSYYVNVSGIADGLAGGNYTFAVAAVPEPETYGMFLAGLGIIGLMARRRG
jgi:hypothetical protein